MGKTLQTIATILDNRPKLQWSVPGAKHPPAATDLEERMREEALWKEGFVAWRNEMEKCNVPKHLIAPENKKGIPLGARAGTLVICPVIALYQWREEIKKFTQENTLSVCCYHGTNRQKEFPREILCKYDIVLTTYQVIEADFRKMVSPNKIKCPNCGGNFRIDKLKVHLKYFCGEGAQRTEAQARQRRTADRHSGRVANVDAPKRRKNGSNKKSFTAHTTTNVKESKKRPESKTESKKIARARKIKGYESDNDLSVSETLDLNLPRPRRSAAVSASKKLQASAKQWGSIADTTDFDSFSNNESSSGGSSCESSVGFTSATKKRNSPTTAEVDSSSDDKSSDSASENDSVVVRATAKQRLALARAQAQKSNANKSTKSTKSLGSKNTKGKKNNRKKALPDESSSADSNSSDEDRDPLEGVDLDQLMQDAMKGSRQSALHMMCWWRVVLDEAHVIKSRSSQTAASAFALTSIHRWCLSGTPLQNRVGELYSLIRFLRIDPMAHYFCRATGCGCKSVHYRMINGRCQDCGHGTIQHFSHFNKHVLNPIQRAGYQGDGRRAMMKLKDEVLDKALIRRTKQSRAEDMNLPPRVVTIRTVRLHPIEDDFYNALYTQTKSSFDDYVTQGTLLNNYAHIFDLLTKMRQAVDHPYLIVYSKKNEGMSSASGPRVANGSVDCELCHEPPTDRVVSTCCGSGFCRSCVVDYMTPALDGLQEGTQCPCCRQLFSVDLSQENADVVDDSTLTVGEGTGSVTAGMPSLKEMAHVSSGSILRRINLAEFATSTKIEALVQELVQMRQHRPGSKALVFSQFVNMLDLVRWRLHSDPCLQGLGLGVRIIHGGMNINSRDDALKDFRENSSIRVLLMSLKAGGVALNLTVANEAYLLDPWWNP
jgi:DNA repair protein RAD16